MKKEQNEQKSNNYQKYISLFLCVICAAQILFGFDGISLITKVTEHDITLSKWYLLWILMAAGFLILVIYLMEETAFGHGILCAFLFSMLLFGINFGITIGYSKIIPVCIFLIGETVLAPWKWKKQHTNNHIIFQKNDSYVIKSLFFCLIFVSILASMAVLFVGKHSENLYESTYTIEGILYRFLEAASGTPLNDMQNGFISKRNHYPMGTIKIELTINQPPTEPLYLHGFESKDYIGGKWTRSNDTRVLSEIEFGEENTGFSSMSNRYESMYYNINLISGDNQAGIGRTLSILHTNGRYTYSYSPYYSRREYTENYYNYLVSREYRFRYYESGEMAINWENVQPTMKNMIETYQTLQKDYAEMTRKAYMDVPTQQIPRLVQLCADHPCETVEDATAFILNYLASEITYTKTPGWSVGNMDVVEDFLFEKKRGYCEHFATAATLMYRLYGIPARYASGFRVPSEAFTKLENGNYFAEVTDEHAHAWTEIFIENYGWTPIEVTPAGDGISTMPSFEFFSIQGITINDEEEEESETAILVNIEEEEEDEDTEETVSNTIGQMTLKQNTVYDTILKLFYLIDTIGLLILSFELMVCVKKQKIMALGSRKLFSVLLSFVQYCGLMKGYTGTENDLENHLIEELSDKISTVSRTELNTFLKYVQESAYSNREQDTQKRDYVLEISLRIMQELYAQQNWHHKLYIKALGHVKKIKHK